MGARSGMVGGGGGGGGIPNATLSPSEVCVCVYGGGGYTLHYRREGWNYTVTT